MSSVKTQTLKLKAALLEAEQECWREIESPGDKSLEKLAEAIIRAFGFDMDHAYGFYGSMDYFYQDATEKYELFADLDFLDDPDNDAKGVQKTLLKDVFNNTGKKMQFIFDYGDEWRFSVELTGYGEKIPRKRYPCMVDSHGTAPQQYPDWEDEDELEDGEVIGINPKTGEILRFARKQE